VEPHLFEEDSAWDGSNLLKVLAPSLGPEGIEFDLNEVSEDPALEAIERNESIYDEVQIFRDGHACSGVQHMVEVLKLQLRGGPEAGLESIALIGLNAWNGLRRRSGPMTSLRSSAMSAGMLRRRPLFGPATSTRENLESFLPRPRILGRRFAGRPATALSISAIRITPKRSDS